MTLARQKVIEYRQPSPWCCHNNVLAPRDWRDAYEERKDNQRITSLNAKLPNLESCSFLFDRRRSDGISMDRPPILEVKVAAAYTLLVLSRPCSYWKLSILVVNYLVVAQKNDLLQPFESRKEWRHRPK
jgi:hypothetical protein